MNNDRPNGISPSQFHKVMTGSRKKGVTFGKTAQSYAEEIVQRLMGVKIEQYVSQAMLDGIEREPMAVEAYEREKLVDVKARDPQVRIVHPKYNYISGEPDGLVGDEGLIEVKSPNEANHFKNLLNGEQITQYRYQIQGYMWLSDRQWCDFCSFNPNYPKKYQISIDRVIRDDDMISELEERCVEFWNELVIPLKQKVEQL